MQFLNDHVDLCLCGFHDRRSEGFVVLSHLELHFGLLYFVCLFMMTVVVPLSAFLRFMAGLFLSSFRAAISLRDKLFLGLLNVISASCVLTLSK